MADKQVVREDVVKVSWEVEKSPLGKIAQEANALKGSLGGIDESGLSRVANQANKGAAEASKLKTALSDVAKSDVASGITNDIEVFNARIGVAKDKFTQFKNTVKGIAAHPFQKLDKAVLAVQMSAGRARTEFKNLAATKLTNLKTNITNIKNALTGGQSGIKGFTTGLKNLAKIGFESTLRGIKSLGSGIKTLGGAALSKAKSGLQTIARISWEGLKKGVSAVASGLKTMASHAASAAANLAKCAGKAVIGGLAAGAAAVGALGVSAVKSYAEYEQLVGGVDTLFKESSKKVQDYANNAYQTAGLSANAYMDTVTSFSASLLQSLGGDTEAAADLANQAIIDMSDNANKMGTDMSSIQDAYKGFAKQNYTMLDNLKLGKTCHIAQYKPRENGETLALCA